MIKSQAGKRVKRRDRNDGSLEHNASREYASYIMDAITTGTPTMIAGNVLNKGLITNLPEDCCVEVPCLVDKNGVQPTYVGKLPTQLAALNRTNINVQELTVEAAMTLEKDADLSSGIDGSACEFRAVHFRNKSNGGMN